MFGKRLCSIIFLFFFVCGASLFANVVSDIKINGLKKTRNSYMQQVLKKYRGIPADELDTQDIQTTLQEQGLFSKSDIQLESDENGDTVIIITVEEKISFIPLPFASYSSGGAMGGLMIMDTNAFGVKDMYVVGGILSTSMQMGMMSFSKPSLALTKPGFSLSGSVSRNTTELTDSDEDTVLEYKGFGANGGLSLSDRITEHSLVSIGARYNYNSITLKDDYKALEDDIQSYHALAVNGSWNIGFTDWNGWFLSTKMAHVNGDVTFFNNRDPSQSVSGQISLQQPLPLARLRLLGQVSGIYTWDAHVAMLPTRSAVGIAIMPSNFHSTKMAGTTAGLELGLFKWSWATISVYGLYECIVTEDWDKSTLVNQGYSVGAKMYLAKIAFPALAFGIAHNVTKNTLQFAAAFGVAF